MMADIRRLDEGDASELFTDVAELYAQLSSNPPPLTLEQMKESLSAPDIITFGAFEDGILVGMGTLVLMPLLNRTEAYIHDLAVASSERENGLGRKIVLELVERARKDGAVSCDLTCQARREAANHLYRTVGFALHETNLYRFRFQES